MRRIYILRENEEDGRLLDALAAAGRIPDESTLANPVCPRCGCSTLLAFAEDEEFQVVLWEQVDETDGADAHAWYLVCSRFNCPYQEEVERVLDPMGAEIFDQQSACAEFDEYSGLMYRTPTELIALVRYLRAVLAKGQSPKVACMLEEAEWRYEEAMEWRWKWIRRVPLGKRIRFSLVQHLAATSNADDDPPDHEDHEIDGIFVATTDEGFSVLRHPDEALLLVRALDLYSFQPRRPDQEDLPKKTKEVLAELFGVGEAGEGPTLKLITSLHSQEWVVIRGHHLPFDSVDRLGQYRVRCWDPAVAEALALTPRGKQYWEGFFRRSDVEARYDLTQMVKTKGHWVDVIGQIGSYDGEQQPYVRTDDPAVAAELGLEEQKPLHPPETEAEKRRYRRSWAGEVPEAEIEDRREVKLYHWPLPEFKTG